MLFMDFSRTCEKLEAIPGRLEMIDIISRELPGLDLEELPVYVRFVMGRIFPDWSSRKLGIGPNLLYEAISAVAGIRREQVIERINRTGDIGQAVEDLLAVKSQTTFFHEELDLVHVYTAAWREKIPSVKNCSRSGACSGTPTRLKAGTLPGSCSRSCG